MAQRHEEADAMHESRRSASQPKLERIEEQTRASLPRQMRLFDVQEASAAHEPEADPCELTPSSSLTVARGCYRQYLERRGRPPNTVESYTYDLVRFSDLIGPKPVNQITQSDVAQFLGQADNRATRKRRLTSLRGFFDFLIGHVGALTLDPTDGFQPHLVLLRRPEVLSDEEREFLIAAADRDESWAAVAVRLMLNLGLTRGELLQLRREHVTVQADGSVVISVEYNDPEKRAKERRLVSGSDLGEVYTRFLEAVRPSDLLFTVGFQAVNGMVKRVAAAAGIEGHVTPQTLRHTFAFGHAKAGASAADLIALLGLVDEPRNRASVERYLDMARPPLRAEPGSAAAAESE
jgi:integrase/recombinase XerD